MGGETAVTYEFFFVPGHKIPKNGALSIYFPEEYKY